MSLTNLTWPRLQHQLEDYPAVTTVIAMLLSSFVPFIQYHTWVDEGLPLGQAAFQRGQLALVRGDYNQAYQIFKESLAYYKRPLIFNYPQAQATELRLAQTYQLEQ